MTGRGSTPTLAAGHQLQGSETRLLSVKATRSNGPQTLRSQGGAGETTTVIAEGGGVLLSFLTHVCACTHTDARTYTHTHIYTRTHMHTQCTTLIHMYICAHTLTHAHIHMHTYTHYNHFVIHALSHTCAHMHRCATHVYTLIYTLMRAYTPSCIRTPYPWPPSSPGQPPTSPFKRSSSHLRLFWGVWPLGGRFNGQRCDRHSFCFVHDFIWGLGDRSSGRIAGK